MRKRSFSPKLQSKNGNKHKPILKPNSTNTNCDTRNSTVQLPNTGLPIFVPVIVLIQVGIYYTSTTSVFYYLQADPLRRFEIWRLVTPSLVHETVFLEELPVELRANLRDAHLWGNVVGLLWFGWRLESVMGWHYTAMLYIMSATFGSLFSSAQSACFGHSVGASDVMFGFMAAHLSGHIMMGRRHPQLAFLTAFLLAICPLLNICFGIAADEAAHVGGAVGGFVAASYIWNSVLPNPATQHKKNVTKICAAMATTVLAVTGCRHLYFANFMYTHITDNVMKVLVAQNPIYYEKYALDVCNFYWGGNDSSHK